MVRWMCLLALAALTIGAGAVSQSRTSDESTDRLVAQTGAEGTGAEGTGAAAPGGDVARGQYLVETVIGCVGCHTPRSEAGGPDRTRLMAGRASFVDLAPDDDAVGSIPSPNLTPDQTGLGDWTDEQIRLALTEGRNAQGEPLFPIMPYWAYHNLTREDADAIVAYLRSLPPVANEIPARQPLPMPFEAPAAPVTDEMIPQSTIVTREARFAAAARGRYLVSVACVGCHTEEAESGPLPVRADLILAGGHVFHGARGDVVSTNLTPDPHGLEGWSEEDVATALLEGRDPEGRGVCGPMPSGPDGHLGDLAREDALAIGTYLTSIPPIDNGEIPACSVEAEGE